MRELENSIERAVVLCRSEILQLGDLPESVRAAVPPEGCGQAPTDGLFVPFGTPLEEIERLAICGTLQQTQGDQ